MTLRSSVEAHAVSIHQQFVHCLREHLLINDPLEKQVSLEHLGDLQEQARQLLHGLPDSVTKTKLEVLLQRTPRQHLILSSRVHQVI